MFRIDFQNAFCFEHRIVRIGEYLFHRKAWAHFIGYEANGAGFQAAADFYVSHFIAERFFNILD